MTFDFCNLLYSNRFQFNLYFHILKGRKIDFKALTTDFIFILINILFFVSWVLLLTLSRTRESAWFSWKNLSRKILVKIRRLALKFSGKLQNFPRFFREKFVWKIFEFFIFPENSFGIVFYTWGVVKQYVVSPFW